MFVRSTLTVSLAFAALAPLAGCAVDDVGGTTSDLSAVTGFGSNPGALRMYLHTPATVATRPALVVAMHGCTQTAANYTLAGWNELADTEGFYVVYPEQQTSNNGSRCFQWFDATETSRGGGEVESVAQMVRWMIANRGVDASRVYVTGLSAGGGLTTAMLGAYPDLFAGGAVMAGLPYECATSSSNSFTCMNPGRDLSPAEWAAKVFTASSHAGPWPRVSIWAGTSDFTVRPMNAGEIADQWTGVWGISASPSLEETVSGATHRLFLDGTGRAAVETWSIPNMGHGTAVDPARGCGTAGSFILNAGICSTRRAAEFWGLIGATPTPTDAGTPLVDASSAAPDAFVAVDAATVDAAVADAAVAVDAASPGSDAARPDAFVAVDAAVAIDAASAPDAAVVIDAATAVDAAICREVYATNWDHVRANRAVRCGTGNSYVCTVGGGDNLGLWTLISTWVRETAPGYYRAGRCAP